MFVKLTILLSILFPCICLAQTKPAPVVMQMQDGKIYFDNAYSLNAELKKDELYKRALKWFNRYFPYPEKYIDTAKAKKGELGGTGIFKIITGKSGHFYWLRFTIKIIVHNATYELKAYDFYEKPIESGVSNEYSKIEYRWWDYRQGKPWSAEDETLFKGLQAAIKNMTNALESAMIK